MANNNIMQQFRSSTTAAPPTLANGQLAFSSVSNTLFIGYPAGVNTPVVPIGGVYNYGILTANQALVTNSSSGINQLIASNLQIQYISANGSYGTAGYVLTSGGGANDYWAPATSQNVASLTSNNTNYIGSTSAANVVSNAQLQANLTAYFLTAGLASNVATLTANNTAFVGTVTAANVVSNAQLQANLGSYTLTSTLGSYQTTAGLPSNVATLTSNSTNFIGTLPAANVVSNAQLQANISNFVNTSQLSGNLTLYVTAVGLPSNVTTLTANNTAFVGAVTAANVVSNAQLVANLANYALTASVTASLGSYQTMAGLASNVSGLTANAANFIGNLPAANVVSNAQLQANISSFVNTSQLSGNLNLYITAAGLPSNVTTLTANNTLFVGLVSSANVVSNAQLAANLANYPLTSTLTAYQTTGGLAGNVVTLTSNNSTNFAGQPQSYYANINSPIFTNSISIGANITINNSVISIGNSTVNVQITSTTSLGGGPDIAGGSNTQVMYNNSGVEAGSAGFTFNNTTNNVTIANTLTAIYLFSNTLKLGVTVVSANYMLLSTDAYVIATAPCNLTLPTAINSGGYKIKSATTGNVGILTTGGQTIDGNTSVTITQIYTALEVVSSNVNWFIF